VPSQVLNNFEAERAKPFMLRDILPGPAWAPYQSRCLSFPGETEGVSDGDEDEGSCVKGSLIAIGLEGVTALAVYGVWLLWHMVR